MLELSYRSWRLKPYAEDLDDDGAPFRWDPERRDLLRADLDAAFLHIYGLNRKEADRALESFPVVKKYDQSDFGELPPADVPAGHGPRHPRRQQHRPR